MKQNKKKSVFQEAQQFFSDRGIPSLKLVFGPEVGWRSKAKLAVQGTSEEPLIGLYKEGTHDVEDMVNCVDHHPQINKAIEHVRAFIRKKGIAPYQEKTGLGVLRYLQFALERHTGKVQVTFVLNKSEEKNPLFWTLDESDLWHSVWLNFNTTRTNSILGPHWKLISGSEWLWNSFNGVEACFHPASFTQANLDLFEKMLQEVGKFVPSSTGIAEFYAGVGVIGLSLASEKRMITCCEMTPQAEICFQQAKNKLSPEVAARIDFYQGTTIKHLDLLQNVDLVIVDPPRKGLDHQFLEELKKTKTNKRLLYVSCGWKSFQRDCDELLLSGWRLVFGEAYLFFPGTQHLEVFAVFDTIPN